MELSVFHHSWPVSVLVETETGRHCNKAKHSCEVPTAVRLVERGKRGYDCGMGLADRTAGAFNIKMRLENCFRRRVSWCTHTSGKEDGAAQLVSVLGEWDKGLG